MQKPRLRRSLRALHASSVVLAVVVACTVADKGDYKFTDEEPGAGGESEGGTGGTSGKGGASGSAGKGGTSGRGGSSGKGGMSGDGGAASGEGGEAGTPGGAGAGGSGGEAGQPGGKCGDGTVDVGEDCDDNNLVNEPCAYGSATCSGCSDRCRRIRAGTCGDSVRNGANATSMTLQYLSTDCRGVRTSVPLYLNGVPIPNLPWATGGCGCASGIQTVQVSDPAVLGALRQQGNVMSLISEYGFEGVAWVVMTVAFDNGQRLEKVAYDYGNPGDAEARNPGVPMCADPLFMGSGNSDGLPFGGFPVEQCDGGSGCYSCALPQCVTLTSNNVLAIPDYDNVNSSPGTVQDFIIVPQLGTIRDVDVTINVQHTYDGDLGISLSSPNTSVSLVERKGGGGDNFTGTVFDSSCTTVIAGGYPPFTGCFNPEVSLDTFNGFTSSIGPWYLTIKDNLVGDIGNLMSWSLKVCGAP